MVHSRDNKGIGAAHKITSPETASIFPDDDGAVLESLKIDPKCF